LLPYLTIVFFAILEGEIYYSAMCAKAVAGELHWFPVMVAGALGGATGDQFWFYLLRGRIHWLDRYAWLAQYRDRVSARVHSLNRPNMVSVGVRAGLAVTMCSSFISA